MKTQRMPRNAAGSSGLPKPKQRAAKAHKLPERFPSGEVLLQAQMVKRKWQLGDVIGQGGFGLIYKASDVTDDPANSDPEYVIKIEPLDNGPLFCEFHFYQRVAKPESITEWTKVKKLRYLGVPQFLGFGQHKKGERQYRFLVLPRLSTDLQKIFQQNNRSFSEKSTRSIGLRMLDALEYIHDKGYCHADIKAANILLGYKNGKTDYNQVYLVDYGLAHRFLVDDTHKPYKEEPKRAHDGTVEYASRDAHKGVYPSRRGDLESLGYCMLEWLSGSLPWGSVLSNKDRVCELKVQFMNDLPSLLKACFGLKQWPDGLKKYLEVVSKLAYDEKPDYNQLRQFLRPGSGSEWTLGLPVESTIAKGTKRKNDSLDRIPSKEAKIHPKTSPASARPAVGKKAAQVSGSGLSVITNGSAKSKTTSRRQAKSADSSISRRKLQVSLVKIPDISSKRASPAVVSPAGPKSASSAAMISKRNRSPEKPAQVKRRRNRNATSSDSAVQTSPGFGLQNNNN